MTNAPTEEDIDKAREYAMKKLCEYMSTKWTRKKATVFDDRTKTCQITESGCNYEGGESPFSQLAFEKTSGHPIKNFLRSDTNVRGKFNNLWKIDPPEQLVWKNTSDGRMGCSRANTLFYSFCEYPGQRSPGSVPGFTNVPKFNYKIVNGKEKCEIPKAYCDSRGVDYDAGKQECNVPTHQKAQEFLSSSVVVRRNRVKSDKQLKTNIILKKQNYFCDGVHLYTFTWKPIAKDMYNLEGDDIGVIADELPYELDEHGMKEINLDNLDIKKYFKVKMFYNVKNNLIIV